ncbi:PEGA domain-containing protein [Calidithermus chliarophilus]|uniref:PEGA domain-containing protein n=1 Tax=Calidithermus chliarophilus TaxID=52023 RepID=UPI0003FED685|nr:PEGA domain-containing protein [Calidithermus chliarophilus]
MKRAIALLLLGMLAYAEPQISPQRIIVNPVPTDLQVRVWVDKDPGKSGNPVYENGEQISIGVQVNQDAYVYLLSIDAGGDINPILPNRFDDDNFLRANESRRFPPQGARYTYNVSGPNGQNRVLAVASKRKLDIGRVLDVANNYQPRVQGDQLGRTMAIVVNPVPDQEWTSDVAFFTVGRSQPQPQPRNGTLNINSNPQGAEVFIDGRSVGRTPLRITLEPGRYRLEFVLNGYERSGMDVRLDPGENATVTRDLTPVARRNATLVIDTNPQGAQVLMDGRNIGTTPLRVSVAPGTYRLEFVLGGYERSGMTVRVDPGETMRVERNLSPVAGIIEFYSNVDAIVYVDGKEAGRTKNGYLRLRLNPGERQIVALAPGYQVFVTNVRVGGNQTIRANLSRL